MSTKAISCKIRSVEEQMSKLSERLYQPQINPSDYRELTKRKKKLEKELIKLKNKLENSYE